MGLDFICEAVIPATPAEVYTAWLDGDSHAAMTGAPAEGQAEPGSSFQAWGGYISGRNLELVENQKIVQAWRTSEFSSTEADSHLVICLEAVEEGTRVRIEHTNLPAHGMQYLEGWKDHYFTPMTAYFLQPD
jgi:activator of HSP90 ATPase